MESDFTSRSGPSASHADLHACLHSIGSEIETLQREVKSKRRRIVFRNWAIWILNIAAIAGLFELLK